MFAAVALCVMLPGAASGEPTARISAGFSPERLGASTTVSFGFHIAAGGSVAPPSLSAIQLRFPGNLGFATSGLGLATCSPQALEVLGPEACPANSKLGYGDAVAEIPLGSEPASEAVRLQLFAGPSPDGYLHLLLRAAGSTPLIAEVLLSGVLRPGQIDIAVPPIPTLPSASNVAVVRMQLTLGGNLTYYETVGGRRRAYRPPGVGLPGSCPPGGFRFAATFSFTAATPLTARTSVACPPRRRPPPPPVKA